MKGIAFATLAATAVATGFLFYGEPAFCDGQPVEPTGTNYVLHDGCVLNLQAIWPDGVGGATVQASSDGGRTWSDVTSFGEFGGTPGLVSGAAFDTCHDLGPGVWSFRFRAVDGSVVGDPFPYGVVCPPTTLVLPDPITVNAISSTGAAVSYPVQPGVLCEPASGSTFPIGTSTVACSAGRLEGTFTVHVLGAEEQLAALGLDRVLRPATQRGMCGQLRGIETRAGATGDATLAADAARIRTVLGC